MERLKDVAAIVDRWEGKDGEEQVKWHSVGELVKTSKGTTMMRVWSLPCGNKWDGALFFFDPKPTKKQFDEGMAVARKSLEVKDEDIPF